MLSAKPYVLSWDENRRQGAQQQTCKLTNSKIQAMQAKQKNNICILKQEDKEYC